VGRKNLYILFCLLFTKGNYGAHNLLNPNFDGLRINNVEEIEFNELKVYRRGATYMDVLALSFYLANPELNNLAEYRLDRYSWALAKNQEWNYLSLTEVDFAKRSFINHNNQLVEKNYTEAEQKKIESFFLLRKVSTKTFNYVFAYKINSNEKSCTSLGQGWKNISKEILKNLLIKLRFQTSLKEIFKSSDNKKRYFWSESNNELTLFSRDIFGQVVFYESTSLRTRESNKQNAAFCMYEII